MSDWAADLKSELVFPSNPGCVSVRHGVAGDST